MTPEHSRVRAGGDSAGDGFRGLTMSSRGLLPDSAQIGRVRLAVSDLSRSLSYYTTVLGFSMKTRLGDLAALTARNSTDVLIELQEIPGIRPLAHRSRLGLYHFAVLLPSRSTLAGFAEHLLSSHVTFGSADHYVSEALYLRDPDGIQIEVYADRPRSSWAFHKGEPQMGVEQLRLDELLAVHHEAWAGTPATTILGHVHFYVGDLEQAQEFYHSALGLDVMHSSYPGALFLSAGGYHHHVGLNTWALGAPLAHSTDARLLFWELLLEDEAQVLEARRRLERAGFFNLVDPWQNRLLLRARV